MLTYAVTCPGVYEVAADMNRAAAIAQKHINRKPWYVVVEKWLDNRCLGSTNVEHQPARHDFGEALVPILAARLAGEEI